MPENVRIKEGVKEEIIYRSLASDKNVMHMRSLNAIACFN